MLLSLMLLLSSALGQEEEADRQLTVMVLLPVTGDWPVGRSIAGAVPVALHAATSDVLPGWDLHFVWNDTRCHAGTGLGEVVSMYLHLTEPLRAIIGGGCDSVCEVVGLLAAHWQVPMASWGCQSTTLSHKSDYPTVARTVAPLDKAMPTIAALLHYFDWHRVVILASSEKGWQLAGEKLKVGHSDQIAVTSSIDRMLKGALVFCMISPRNGALQGSIP